MNTPDFTFENYGSIWLCRPKSEELRLHLKEVTDGLWHNGALVVEPRYLDNFLAKLGENGWRVSL